jgi:hypothetical protein
MNGWQEHNDRLWILCQYGGVRLITGSSTVTPKHFWMNTGLYSSNDCHTYLAAEDPGNENHVWLGGWYGRWAKFDITDVISGASSAPTKIQDGTQSVSGNFGYSYGYNFDYLTPVFTDDDTGIVVCGIYESVGGGWFDPDNGEFVGKSRGFMQSTLKNDDERFPYYPDSAGNPFQATSSAGCGAWTKSEDGTDYFIAYGYGTNNDIFSFSKNIHALATSGYVTFGDYQLPGQENVSAVKVNDVATSLNVPNGCSATIDVSNDGGTTWHNYDWQNEETFVFPDIYHNTVRVRFNLNGLVNKAPYWQNNGFPTVTMIDERVYSETLELA